MSLSLLSGLNRLANVNRVISLLDVERDVRFLPRVELQLILALPAVDAAIPEIAYNLE